jgi:hypothetical protein
LMDKQHLLGSFDAWLMCSSHKVRVPLTTVDEVRRGR